MVSRSERLPDFEESLRYAQTDIASRIWCGGPGIIESVNLTAMTCTVQPAIQGTIRLQNGNMALVTLPLLVDVPLQFPQGGGLALTFPVAQGNECYFSIADRCIDNWWQSGGVQPPAELRMHDLSDGFAFVGVNSQPHVIQNISSTSTQLRTISGSSYIELTQAGVINIHGPVNITGAVTVMGNVATTGTFKNNTVNVGSTHEHSGVQTGTSLTGGPQ
jgi:hypothetical protein